MFIITDYQNRHGGLALYINNNIKRKKRYDLTYLDYDKERLFIKIVKEIADVKSNVLIGIVYNDN